MATRIERPGYAGICMCTTLYHGSFEGRSLTIEPLGTFILQELKIPGGFENQQRALKINGCYWFVDVHQEAWRGGRNLLEVELLDPVPFGPRQIYRLHRGRSWGYETQIEWDSRSEDPPSYEQIEEAMRHELLKRCPDQNALNEWLSHWEAMARQIADGVRL